MTHDFHTERKTLHRPSQTLAYPEAGPLDGPPLIFVHGWPALAWAWRHQMARFAALGYHTVAPDLRGYGQSTVPRAPSAYRQELIVDDMIALLDHLGLG
ncbi:alpha/beta fold hydrolase [Streptomyces sp. NPDC003710]